MLPKDLFVRRAGQGVIVRPPSGSSATIGNPKSFFRKTRAMTYAKTGSCKTSSILPAHYDRPKIRNGRCARSPGSDGLAGPGRFSTCRYVRGCTVLRRCLSDISLPEPVPSHEPASSWIMGHAVFCCRSLKVCHRADERGRMVFRTLGDRLFSVHVTKSFLMTAG